MLLNYNLLELLASSEPSNIRHCELWSDNTGLQVRGLNNSMVQIYCDFAVLHLNARTRSLRRSGLSETLRDFLATAGASLHAVVVSETWPEESDLGANDISGFTFVGVSRQTGRQGDDVGVYIRSGCEIVSHSAESSADGNVQAGRVHIRKRGFEGHVVGFYSSNFVHRSTLLDILENMLTFERRLPVIVTGDLNVNLLSNDSVEEYSSSFSSRGYRLVIDEVTRPAANTCIDHIAVRDCDVSWP